MNLLKKWKEKKERQNHKKWLRSRRYRIEVQGDKVMITDKYSNEIYKKSTLKLIAATNAAQELAAAGMRAEEIIIDGLPWQEYLKQIYKKKK